MRSQRSPAAMPRCGSRSAKTLRGEPIGQRLRLALFLLEWLTKMRDMLQRPMARRGLYDAEGYAGFGDGSKVAGTPPQFGS